jgi:hypothetical protein
VPLSPAITLISGGQTGADRAALDFAIARGIPHGGWCPRGRLAEDGPLTANYNLRETTSRKYAQRTEWNVRDSDATVIFSLVPEITGGTRLTLACALQLKKPVLHLYPQCAGATGDVSTLASMLLRFIAEHEVRTLNIAGPRATQSPQIERFVSAVLEAACSTP